ncbi:hypothetical protein L7F22_026106 [Adiantum nelumboides]|nr:hypothetical protein [Adiantum nelumboides]
MNVVRVLPSPSGSKAEPKIPVKVMTRAQAKENAKDQASEEKDQQPKQRETTSVSVRTGRKLWKAKREKAKARHEQNQVTLVVELSQAQEELKQHREKRALIVEPNKVPRRASLGGSMLVDKVLEPLDAALEAYEARLKPNQTLEQRGMKYSQAKVETERLKMYKELVKIAQVMMEPKLPISPPKTKPKSVGFEMPKAKVVETSTNRNIELESQKDVQAKTAAQETNNLEIQLDDQVVANTTDDARWRAPKVRCPLQTTFCQIKKYFNNHYGLDTEGKDPRLLKDSDVLEGDRLSVFSHSRDTSSYRVKCNSICPEQYKDLLIFYMKVYQKRPTNMEVNVSFARAYVLQFSLRVVKAKRSVQFAWAIVGEEHNNDLKKSGHFHTHYLRWKVINGAGDSIVGTVNVKEPNIELISPPPIAPLASHSLSVQLTNDRTKEGKLRSLIEDFQCRLTVAKDEHATCLKNLEARKVQQLSDEKFGKALSLLDEQISATKLKLASVAEDDLVTRIQLASQLEAQESIQAVLGVGLSEPANVPMLTAEVEFLADVVKEKEMQHNLLQEMLHRVEVGRRAYICPPPPFVMSPTLDNFTLPTKCAGCGLANVKELADANKDIAEVLEDLSSQGFSSAELDLGNDSPLGHFHKVLASRKGCVHLGSCSSLAKKWKPSAGGCMLVMWVPCHLYIAVDCSAKAEMHVVWMSKIYCLFAATPHPQQFLVRFNQRNLPIAVEDEVLVLIFHPPPPVKKKKRKRQKPTVPIEEIVIDRVLPPLQIDLPDLNQCPPPLANDPRVLIMDLNGVLLSHFWPGEEIPKHTKRMTEVAYQNGQWVFVCPEALQFLLWCFDHFTVFVWSCVQVSNVSSLVCKAFPKIWKKFADRIMSQSQCTRHKGDAKVPKTNKPIFYKELSRFWHGNDKYNASNTLIADDSVYKCFHNL